MREMALFAVIRLVLWAGIWWVLTLFDIGVMLAGVLAALIAMLISILFLNRVRDAAAMRWKAADDKRRERHPDDVDEDAEAEDSFLDAEAAAADGTHGVEVTGTSRATDASHSGPGELPELPAEDPENTSADGR
ncbi:DUF4229 domain-containing protein [Brachybacterium sp. AOP3-A1-3]|uniref:DUF4229 domain-containing protein n=1 Tax=Brachybacterium sp. AOP3-A1-3 TaxID=3457699 RepID=UPI00403318E0